MRGILDHISPFRNCQSYQFSAEQLMGLTEDLLILMTEVLAKNLPQIVHVTAHHIQEVSLLRRVAAGVKDQALDSKLLKRSDRSCAGVGLPRASTWPGAAPGPVSVLASFSHPGLPHAPNGHFEG